MENIDQEIQSIVDSRIFKAATSIKAKFPESISTGTGFYVNFGNEKFHIVVFLDNSERGALEDRLSKRYDPFPGLLTTEDGVGAAFRLENIKNSIIKSCVVKNSYALSLGKNTSIVLIDHTQEVDTQEMGLVKYVIDLAFIISFPDDSPTFSLRDSFDDLISYYISTRREEK